MEKLAINGGKKIIDEENFWYSWPVIDENDKKSILKVLEEKRYCRLYEGSWAEKFEKKMG